MRINIKPLSVNEAYTGKRYKTPEYRAYEKHLLLLLRPLKIDSKAKLALFVEFGVSNGGSDGDNPLKPFIDVIQKKHAFNDNRIYRYYIQKVVVNKGEEYIDYLLEEMS